MESQPTRDAVLDPYPQALVRSKAYQLSRQRGFRRRDEEDVRQELFLRVLAALPRFDPERGEMNAFIRCVVETAAAMMSRERAALKRSGGAQPVSLDQAASIAHEQGPTLASQLTPVDLGRRLGLVPIEPVPTARVQAAIADLSPEDQAICRQLMVGTPSSAAKRTGKSRRQIRNAMLRIRRHFELDDLGNF